MAEYITKKAVHELVFGLKKYAWASPSSSERHITVDTDDVNFGVDHIPSADVAPVVHGNWIIGDEVDDFDIKCPVCGWSDVFNVAGIAMVKSIAGSGM